MIILRALFQLLNQNSDAVLSPSVGDGSQMSVTLSTGLFVDMMMADNRILTMANNGLWLCTRLYYRNQKIFTFVISKNVDAVFKTQKFKTRTVAPGLTGVDSKTCLLSFATHHRFGISKHTLLLASTEF
jgi:hypothetical protein